MKDKLTEISDDLNHGIITEKEAKDKLLFLCGVSNCANKIERPSPYKWIKEEKFKIPDGASYREPKVNLIQCANWISEYVKKHCC